MTDAGVAVRDGAPVIKCEALTLAVPGRVLARGVELEVKPGDVWAVLGANGSGKTTLVHTLAGLAPVSRGTVFVGGQSAGSRAARIGVLLQQEEATFWGSVLEYVMLGRFPRTAALFGWSIDDENASRAALSAVGLAGFEHRDYRSLSGGERQRTRIAQLLAQDPDCCLLDEPLQHLDLRHQVAVLKLIDALARGRAKAVIMVLHDVLWPARVCTHALLLHEDGTVERGLAHAMLTRERLERLYGCALREIATDGSVFFAPV